MKHSAADAPEANLRVAPLSNIEPLLRSMGYDPEPVFKAVGLNPEEFLNLEHRISYVSGSRLLDQCVKTTGCDPFGLLLGQFFLVAQLGAPGLLANTAANVNAALHDIVKHFDLHEQGGVATLNTASRYTSFGYVITVSDAQAINQVYDLCITIICGMMRSFCGSEWNPTKVELSRSQPDDTQPYKDYFRAPVIFGSLRNAVVFSNKWLACPLVTADANYHQHFAAGAQALHQSMPNSVSLEVKAALNSTLTHATCNAAVIADMLGLQERTLHRRLHAEGTGFRALLDETRKVSSCNYLKSTALSIGSIATALGYGSTAAFNHAFKRWYGKSPKQWRDSGDAHRPL